LLLSFLKPFSTHKNGGSHLPPFQSDRIALRPATLLTTALLAVAFLLAATLLTTALLAAATLLTAALLTAALLTTALLTTALLAAATLLTSPLLSSGSRFDRFFGIALCFHNTFLVCSIACFGSFARRDWTLFNHIAVEERLD
jgi:hypothetical protein